MAKKVKIKDIASRLGLSSTLVSLVLNNKANQHGIKIETQERVIALAQKMGYFLAKAENPSLELIDVSPGIIGMIVSTLKDPFVLEVSDHLRKAFASIGYGFSIITWDRRDKRFNQIASNLRRMYSGIILTGDCADDSLIRSLKSSNFPFVILEKANVNLRLNVVRSDCEAGASKLVNHIKKFDYKNITIARSKLESPYIKEKIECVKNVLKEEIPDCKLEICELDIGLAGMVSDESLKPLLRQPISTQLFLVAESLLVYPLIGGLNRLKMRIPQDVALISLEDGVGFDLLLPPVTRLKRDIASMSSKVVSMLWTEVKNSGKSKFKRTVNLAPDLVVAKSCGSL